MPPHHRQRVEAERAEVAGLPGLPCGVWWHWMARFDPRRDTICITTQQTTHPTRGAAWWVSNPVCPLTVSLLMLVPATR